jgi:hypothetical protein
MRTLLVASLVVVLLPFGCGSSEKGGSTGGAGGVETGGSGGVGASGGSGAMGTGGATGGGSGAMGGTGGATGGGGSPGPDAGSSGGAGGMSGATDAATSSDTWESFARGFFASYCVACHDDDKKGVAARDYHQLANVMKERVEIACGLAPSQAVWAQRGCSGFPPARQFPVGSLAKPGDAERERVLRWIDAGTP